MSRVRDFLGPYRLTRLIRVGTTCRVWEAVKQSDNTKYAIKVLHEEKRKDRKEIAAMKHEFEVAKNLKHPNVIRIHEFKTEGETPFLVMELFPYPNLKLVMRQQGIQTISFLIPRIIEQAAEALYYLHDQGWVHRDVKPDNFLVSEQGSVKLIDFAISERAASGFAAMFSFFGKKPQGTISYMSPEQIRGKPLDGRADVYSFGCVLFELMTGKLPFTGDNENDLLNRHISAPIPAIQVHNDNVTPEMSNLIRRMMSKRKEDRPASMYDVVKELKQTRPYKISPKVPENFVLPQEQSVSVDDLTKKKKS